MVVAVVFLLAGERVKDNVAATVIRYTYAPFYSLNNGIDDIFSVYRQNRRLTTRVVELTTRNARLREAARENSRLREMLQLRERVTFETIPAEVVGAPAIPGRGTIWISAVETKQLQKGSPVTTVEGLVGNIADSETGLAEVQILYDRYCRVAAIDQRSRVAGVVRWESGPRLSLAYVPMDGDIRVNDTIITSGWGKRYPEGIPIGEVVEVSADSAEFFLSIAVRPFVRFETLEEVFVIQSAEAEAAEEIER